VAGLGGAARHARPGGEAAPRKERALSALATRRGFLAALAATLAFRLWLSAAAPITADEAYFAFWGRHPALGYYDHPPMIGWLLAPLAALSHADWVTRLPATVAPALAALAVRGALARWFGAGESAANLGALALLLAPMNVWNVLVTTDAPLLVFATASLIAFARAAATGSAAMFFLSGLLLGLAFLSKYFAVLLGLAYLAWAASLRRWGALGLALAGALPAGLINLYWNANACWSNIMFNAINRHDGAGLSAWTPLLYAASLAYLAAPLLWCAWRARAGLGWEDPARRALLLAWLVPFAVFAALSPVKRIGLHWMLSFLPALALSCALALERRQLVAAARFFAAFAIVHVAAAVALAALPLETWKSSRLYPRLVFLAATPQLIEAAQSGVGGAVLASDSYSGAAILGYRSGLPVPVFGAGSSHARQDDIRTDWRDYAGKDLLIVRREAPRLEDYRPYFREVEARWYEIAGARFHAVLGRGFDYAAYRTRVLAEVRDRYYRIPGWLPAGRCYFFERYFPP
jgi:4-amino-4-deoxy-L-arabinose transferase-like glycosyltransferase